MNGIPHEDGIGASGSAGFPCPQAADSPLNAYLWGELFQPVEGAAKEWADHLGTLPGVEAVLYYGSGLHGTARSRETVYDFYLLVRRYRDFHDSRWLAAAGRLVPPNVYYFEREFGGRLLRCKCAVMTVRQFLKAAGGGSFTPHIWARFCQPCRIPLVRHAADRKALVDALKASILRFHRRTLHLVDECTLRDYWAAGLRSTYADEIRSEPADYTGQLVERQPQAFFERTRRALPLLGYPARLDETGLLISGLSPWRKRLARAGLVLLRPVRRSIVIVRWIKAAFSFEGGLEYARWKIRKQTGVEVELTPFQRRHPLLGGLALYRKMRRLKALR